MELKDKVIVVTGGANGIGKALCVRFAKEGPRGIAIADIDERRAEEMAEQIDGIALRCDVGLESDIQHVVHSVEETFGPIDVFCANAGIGQMGGVETPNDVWQRVMDINFMSHVYSTRAVLPGMQKRGQGYLVHTASAAGLLSQIGSAPYAVSKHAAVAFAEWLAITYKKSGINVSCVCPMGVWTDMLAADHPAVKMLHTSAITPEDVAESVVEGIREERFLILPHPEVSRYVNNKASDVDHWLSGMRHLADNL